MKWYAIIKCDIVREIMKYNRKFYDLSLMVSCLNYIVYTYKFRKNKYNSISINYKEMFDMKNCSLIKKS